MTKPTMTEEEYILKAETETMKSLMKRNNQISIATLGIMATFLLTMFVYVVANEQAHNNLLNTIHAQSDWTHAIYYDAIRPADSLSNINSRRLDLQSEWGYRKVHEIDSVLHDYHYRIQRNSNEIKKLNGKDKYISDWPYHHLKK